MTNPVDRTSPPVEPDDVAALRRRVYDLEQQLASLPDRDAALRRAEARATRLAEELTAMSGRCDDLHARVLELSAAAAPVADPHPDGGSEELAPAGSRSLLRAVRRRIRRR
jgi:hypothetical protein